MIKKLTKISILTFISVAAIWGQYKSQAGIHAGKYKSQAGQDIFFNEIFFKNKRGGVFVDIGAHDGVSYSNTWFYEKVLGWNGICVEPHPDIFKKLVTNRNCICINGCVSESEGIIKFRQFLDSNNKITMSGGIESKLDARDKAAIEKYFPAQKDSFKIIDIPSHTLNSILEKNKIYYIDFLSVDVEGGEFDILKAIDFDRFYIYTMTVENTYQKTDVRLFLEARGFRYITTIGNLDDVYLNIKLPADLKMPRCCPKRS